MKLRWTPVFSDPSLGLRGIALPALTLALVALAPIARVTRRAVGEALASPPALSGRARGETPREETLRALRRAAPAFAGLGAALVPQLVAGSVLVERVFGLPGTGQLLADSVFSRDLPTVLGLTLVSGLAVVVATLAADAAAAARRPADRRRGGAREPLSGPSGRASSSSGSFPLVALLAPLLARERPAEPSVAREARDAGPLRPGRDGPRRATSGRPTGRTSSGPTTSGGTSSRASPRGARLRRRSASRRRPWPSSPGRSSAAPPGPSGPRADRVVLFVDRRRPGVSRPSSSWRPARLSRPLRSFTAALLIALTGWPDVARLVRAEALRLSASPHVEAARAAGRLAPPRPPRPRPPRRASPRRSRPFPTSSAARSSSRRRLSFLGLGTPPPAGLLGTGPGRRPREPDERLVVRRPSRRRPLPPRPLGAEAGRGAFRKPLESRPRCESPSTRARSTR